MPNEFSANFEKAVVMPFFTQLLDTINDFPERRLFRQSGF